MKAKTKLPYDVPFDTYEKLKDDAERLEIPATQLLVKLVEDNHNRINNKIDVNDNFDYKKIFISMTDEQRAAMLWYGSSCRNLPIEEVIEITERLQEV
jgi:hypothetical protein